jgi:hypothetical protein
MCTINLAIHNFWVNKYFGHKLLRFLFLILHPFCVSSHSHISLTNIQQLMFAASAFFSYQIINISRTETLILT